MSMAHQQQLMTALKEIAALKRIVADLTERLESLEKKAKESKTLGLNKP